MKTFLSTAAGVAAGILLYTWLFDSPGQMDWMRAAFVGMVCGFAPAISARLKKSKDKQEPQ
jgi:hypothetical protein